MYQGTEFTFLQYKDGEVKVTPKCEVQEVRLGLGFANPVSFVANPQTKTTHNIFAPGINFCLKSSLK